MGDNRPPNDAAPVVITGTSTGIGAASAVLLAEKGFRVFAGVRSAADGDALVGRCTGELTPIHIDITDESSISAAVDTVESAVGERGLFGLVNNAGIVKPGPLELQPMADFRRQLEVNLIGQVAVTQAFLPLIRRGNGRIVNVGSIGGHLVLPLHGAYSASKFGMEAVSDALRLELRQWRIPVSHIDPGVTETAIFGKTLAEIDAIEETLRERDIRSTRNRSAASGVSSRRPQPTRRRSRTSPIPWPRRSPPRSPSPATSLVTARRRRWHLPARQPTDEGSGRGARGAPAGPGVAGRGWLRRRARSESRRCRRSCPVSCPAAPPLCSDGSRSRGRGMSRPSGS